ncbi:MAG: hypothetical protein UT43_C0003G0004 [Parcubacteria group bacterium GW2011_GWC1_39_29]|uniref:Methyltransferase type 11 n=1 Tax=Candidatus Yanofskybacteria bacterium GW2011_GWD1_39_16 TaxID=1619030 RepID=A0A837I030_9BACT|nr:MAG: hypothetical protein UT35_C0006G0003 [Candidatus Yanofskybacteria bacterium GW2011_GWD1_39_16]KKR15305.1 MAG: hypothetical protein UT43_C0003G0004 [Parcubacteria group bacterium GW2011_GWC1_39_29]
MRTLRNSDFLTTDPFKEAALKQIVIKEKKHRTYPIDGSDLLIIKKCPLCYSKNIGSIAKLYINYALEIFSTDICHNCLLIFRTVSPNLRWFKKCWKLIQTKKLEVFNPLEEMSREQRYEKYYNIISRYLNSGKMLDVGAAYGTGTNVFRKHGFKVEAVEPEINKVNYLKRILKIDVVCDAIENLVTKKRKYDLIIFSQCFEHIDQPTFIMYHLKNLLRNKNSILYLEIPSIWAYINWSDALYLPHKSNFTEDNIINLVINAGFEILEMFYLWDQSLDRRSPSDIGLVLRYTGKIATALSDKKARCNRFDSESMRLLYRKNLPAKIKLPLNATIKYSVPHIDQFFQTLRLKNKKITVSKSRPDFLVFEDLYTSQEVIFKQ